MEEKKIKPIEKFSNELSDLILTHGNSGLEINDIIYVLIEEAKIASCLEHAFDYSSSDTVKDFLTTMLKDGLDEMFKELKEGMSDAT